MKTSDFVKENARFLSFGFLLTLICNFGQTFFIGFYNPDIRETFHLSNGDFGTLYGGATLFSASMLVWVGRLIDRVDLRVYTIVVMIVMALACFTMYGANGVAMLAISLGLLRLTGQGLMPHISNTSMGRYFETGRGRALSISQMGMSAGQIIFPFMALNVSTLVGWREGWAVYGAGLLLVVLPVTLFFLKGHGERHKSWEAEVTVAESQTGQHSRMRQSVSTQLLRDKKFWLILPGLLSSPLFGTAIFFFQGQLLIAKGWDKSLFAFSFPFYALAMTGGTLLGGFMTDKIGSSMKILPLSAIPFILGLLGLSFAHNTAWLPCMMVLIGLSSGLSSLAAAAMWAELYGTVSLGSIRSLVTSLMVFGTAATPAILGNLYDMGFGIEHSYIVFAGYMAIAALIQIPVVTKRVV